MKIDDLQALLCIAPSSIETLSEELQLPEGAILELAKQIGAQLGDSTLYLNQRPTAVVSSLQKQVSRLQSEVSNKKKLIDQLSQELQLSDKRQIWLDEVLDVPMASAFDGLVDSSELDESVLSHTTSKATAVLLASDWHVGERVDAPAVNYLNEYNPDIARKRAKNFFSHARFLIEKERSKTEIEHCVLWLGGDLITGYIHEELEESNYLSPIEESLLIQELVSEGIHSLLSCVRDVTIVCNYGNHGRTGKKKRISTGAKNSYEWLVYQHLSNQLPEARWLIASGYFNYLKLYNFNLRFHHGDGISYMGGVGGVTIPLIKFVNRANSQTRADLDCVGHFHQLTFHNQFVVNGSLIGVTPYSVGCGFSYERPQQGFLLVHEKHGVISQAPILVAVDS